MGQNLGHFRMVIRRKRWQARQCSDQNIPFPIHFRRMQNFNECEPSKCVAKVLIFDKNKIKQGEYLSNVFYPYYLGQSYSTQIFAVAGRS